MPEAKRESRVQATEVSYELHSLGWKAFQDLCVTLVASIWGQTVQSFFSSKDGGRDGAFHGRSTIVDGKVVDGSYTIQCKFSSKADKQLTLSDLTDELGKAKRLAAKGLADNYLLFANASLTGTNDEKIRTAFSSIPGIKWFAVYGRERISQIIRETPRLRMLVPRVYGLGDLSQILDERAYAQAQEILSALGDDLRKFVITDAYQKSARALAEHGFVLLLGEPACGKSTIAAALAVGSLDEWGNSTIKVRNAEDFVKHSNPNEPKQFFWVDDAFGTTQIDWQATAAWNNTFPHVQAAINRGAKVLFTSRDYIYRSAKSMLKQSALPVMRASQVVIHVEELSKREREQILYNHIRLGRQPMKYKQRIKRLLPEVAGHRRFTPEIARRLGNPNFTKDLLLSEAALRDFVDRPLELTCEIIRTLDESSRAAIGLVFMRGGAVPSPLALSPGEQKAIAKMGSSEAAIGKALATLNESFVLRVISGQGHAWKFKHPSIRDAFAAVVAEDPELLDIYLAGTPVEDLIQEVSCGDLGIEGVKVIVPLDRYSALLARLDPMTSNRGDKESLHRFLARRCDRDFLAAFSSRHPAFVRGLRVSSYLSSDSAVDLLVRLHEFGLLSEEKRTTVIKEIEVLAISTPDAGCFREDIASLFTPEEQIALREAVRIDLLPNLRATVVSWRHEYRGNDSSPSEYFSELLSSLSDFRDKFDGDEFSEIQIAEADAMVREAIKEMEEEKDEEYDDDSYSRDSGSYHAGDDSRSVFDDVDD